MNRRVHQALCFSKHNSALYSFIWQRWLTSRPAHRNCDLVSLICTIRATRCTSTLLTSTGHPTLKISQPSLPTPPFHQMHPSTFSLLAAGFSFKISMNPTLLRASSKQLTSRGRIPDAMILALGLAFQMLFSRYR